MLKQLREFGRTKRGWLGVRIQTVTDEIAESLGLEGTRGALVASVTEGGPAEQGQIAAGDVILAFDGKAIPQMRTLPRVVADTEIGRTVDVELWRRGKSETIKVVVGELAEEEEQLAAADPGLIPKTPAPA